MSKRKQTEEFILNHIKKIVTGNENYDLYKNMFKSMSDKEFHQFMVDLRDGKNILSVIIPNGGNININVRNNIKLAKSLGYEFYQHLITKGDRKVPDYKTPNKYLVCKLPIRRAAQLLSKKISVPSSDKKIDMLTGQVTGESRASKLTMPEAQILSGMGMHDTVKELMVTRGGNLTQQRVANNMLYKTGRTSLKELDEYGGEVESTKTLAAYFSAMHIRSTTRKKQQ